MAITREFFSASVNGRPILVAAVATAGTLIHTAHATAKDEIFMWAANFSGAAIALTVEWGGVTSPADLVEMSIPSKDGPHLIIPGLSISNSLLVRAFAGTTNLLNIMGYINRHAP